MWLKLIFIKIFLFVYWVKVDAFNFNQNVQNVWPHACFLNKEEQVKDNCYSIVFFFTNTTCIIVTAVGQSVTAFASPAEVRLFESRSRHTSVGKHFMSLKQVVTLSNIWQQANVKGSQRWLSKTDVPCHNMCDMLKTPPPPLILN